MIRSMTGYGNAERDTSVGVVRAEIKTVNHRYFRANVRTPSALAPMELQVQEWLKEAFSRGHVNCSLRLETAEEAEAGGAPLQLNEPRARQYLDVLTALKERLELPGEVDVALLSRFGDLIEPVKPDSVEVPEADVRSVVLAAAEVAVDMREEEGRKLHDDLEERLQAIEAALDVIAERAPARLVEARDRLRDAVRELAEDVSADEDRLAREIAYLAERWDIGEERTRLRAHIEAFRDLLDESAADPVGKRLGFLVQEMHREANTIGAKANDAEIEHQIVTVKNEIERLREQIENVE